MIYADGSNIEEFAYYRNADGRYIVLNSPLEIETMELLHSEDLTISQIQKRTDKPLSSLFVMMEQLVQKGLVRQYSDENDGRKKFYHITSEKFFQSLDSGCTGQLEGIIDEIVDAKADLYSGFSMILLALFSDNGVSIEPGLYNIGRNIGRAMFNKSKFESMDQAIMFMSEFIHHMGIGALSLYSLMPPAVTLTWTDGKSEHIREAWEILLRGMIESMAWEVTGRKYVARTTCFVSDNKNRCRFEFDLQ